MREFKYSIGEEVNGLLILENKRVMFGTRKLKACNYKCSKCGYIGVMREDVLSRGANCPCCCVPPKIIVENINSKALIIGFAREELQPSISHAVSDIGGAVKTFFILRMRLYYF